MEGRAGQGRMTSERYDPAAEMKARALAEIAETVAAGQHGRQQPEPYRSRSARAAARRELLRHLADETRRRFMGEPAEPA